MARMPRGEPRSVPDPAGEALDEMLRQERSNREWFEAGKRQGSWSLTTSPFSPDPRLEAVLKSQGPSPTVSIGGQRYRQIDNGQANILAPDVDPVTLARQREAFERADLMAKSPLAGAAYAVASVLSKSPDVQENALTAGAATDSILQSFAPLGARPVGRMSAAATQAPAAPKWREPVRFQNLNARGQATGVDAIVTKSMLGTGSKAYWRLTPPGWQGNGKKANEARGHLLARRLGGTGKGLRNLVTLTQKPTNNGQMSGFEREIADRVRGGEVINYRSVPLYDRGALPPSAILVTATGSRGAPAAQIIANPAGRPK